jgi:hypothetical protein
MTTTLKLVIDRVRHVVKPAADGETIAGPGLILHVTPGEPVSLMLSLVVEQADDDDARIRR